jgi:hypothetical protein
MQAEGDLMAMTAYVTCYHKVEDTESGEDSNALIGMQLDTDDQRNAEWTSTAPTLYMTFHTSLAAAAGFTIGNRYTLTIDDTP